MISTRKVIFLTLFLITLHAGAATAEEQSYYRVEALVLRHLDSMAEARAVAELTDFSIALDLEDRDQTRAQAALYSDDPFFPELTDAALLPPVGPFPDAEPWAEITFLTDRSERMSAVWRNLRLSESFRPEAFLAWEQPSEEPFPLLHLRNARVIRTDDPWSESRTLPWNLAPSEEEDGLPPARDYVFSLDIEAAILSLEPLPEPTIFYEIEGTIRLRRSRFLHIDLDLEFREPTPAALNQLPGPPLLPQYQGYLVHRLKQSRQVRTERMEYFDSPWMGVLVWVTEIEVSDEESVE